MNRNSMMMITLAAGAALTACTGMQSGTKTAPPPPQTLAEVAAARVLAYRDMGAAMDRINAELKLPTPRFVNLAADAARINEFAARKQYTLFPGGSGPETGVATRAKSEIWTQPAAFKIAQDMFKTRAQAFADAATTGKPDAIRAEIPMLGQACGGCHDPFRARAPDGAG